ncbi:MAG TPA: redoxin domain-containing protein [Vicinamibacterales bacterium]|nr:redoxin domain-containing protein [Vicinamibacterales bacterium]
MLRSRRTVTMALWGVLAVALAAQPAEPPTVGDKARDFSLEQLDGSKVTLAAELKNGPVVLVVGRGWVGYQCPFCNRQFADFSKNAAAFEAARARVIWVYPGPAAELKKRAAEFAASATIPASFRFVLDPDFAFVTANGLRWEGPGESAYPATFVIDRGGVIRSAAVSRVHAGRATAADTLAAIAALK